MREAHVSRSVPAQAEVLKNPADLSFSDDDLVGEWGFASTEQRERRAAELLGEGGLVVRVPAPPRSVRGRLSEHMDDAIEALLERLGAPAPAAYAEDLLSDQLSRTRSIGAAGLVLLLEPLAAIARPTLAPEDSMALSSLARATEERPLVLLMDDGDAGLLAYAAPLPLESLLSRPRAAELLSRSESPPAPLEPATAEPPVAPVKIQAPSQLAVSPAKLQEPSQRYEHAHKHGERGPVHEQGHGPARLLEHGHSHGEYRSAHEQGSGPAGELEPGDEGGDESEEALAGFTLPPAFDTAAWRSWTQTLGQTRGPQPLAILERLFTESYVPLSHALVAGLRDPRAEEAHETFRRNFERAYADAFPTFSVTGKRPRMVLDAFETAARIGRQNGARAVSLLAIDAMRFDLGLLVKRALEGTFPRAMLVDETVLFAALPSTTARQLDTLARGAATLAQPAPEEERDGLSLRGKSAHVVRRIRAGSRDLYKLDLVEAWVRDAAPKSLAQLPELAVEVADAIVRHARSLMDPSGALTHGRTPERTLLFVFGDHGFSLDRDGGLREGGSSPEEVMVPGLAFLLEPLH